MSRIGSEIILDNVILISSVNGMDSKKVIPTASSLRILRQLNIKNINHMYTSEMNAITAPMEKT